MADACVFLMEHIDFKDCINKETGSIENGTWSGEIRNTHINIGSGKEISIENLAQLVKNTVGFKGNLYFNTAMPDGTMRKLTDPSKLNNLGWHHTIGIEEGTRRLYEWYIEN